MASVEKPASHSLSLEKQDTTEELKDTAPSSQGPKEDSTSNLKQSQAQAQNSRQIGHYIVGRSLGQGTFGKVRLGTHVLTGEKVAIKILEKDKIKDQSDVERVTREIHILKVVRHPNVVQLYEIIETSRQLFLIMEYASGGELFDYIVKRKRLQEPEACKFFQQILSGVEYIHKVRICHRDLKPENLLLDDRNNVKIVDFGLSNMYKEGETLKTACGSPCYAAPEMIAGKKYHGLNSDIWSCGIILYAMSCGYLPFEDPNTNKLYKKILNCDFLIPGFISANCKDLIKKILNTDPVTRITVKEIKQHEWFNQVKYSEMPGIVVGKDKIPIIDEVLLKLKEQFKDQEISQQQQIQHILNNKHNQITSTYYLLIKKLDREQGGNLVFEAFSKSITKQEQRQSNHSSVNFGSPPQTKTPAKIIMNQTVMGGFHRAGPQQSSKSEGSNGKRIDQPMSKIYLEQIEKIYTKRTESTGGPRATSDSLSGFSQPGRVTKTGNGTYDTLKNYGGTNSGGGVIPSAMIRATQSQSPRTKGFNIQSIQSNASAGPQGQFNQTLYMSRRNPNRPISIDENTNMVITSTNDSRIQEMLPKVQNSHKMRTTLYGAPKQPQAQVSNTGYTTNLNNSIINQKKQDTGAMNVTMYGGGMPAYLNNSVITKALAQTKIRKYRAHIKNLNNSSIVSDEDQRDPRLITMYKVRANHPGTYFSNRVAVNPAMNNQSFDYGTQNPPTIGTSVEKPQNMSFSAAPNSTATRFYNPHRHNRFLSNHQKPVFQNNFVLPMTLATKTFYGKKQMEQQESHNKVLIQ